MVSGDVGPVLGAQQILGQNLEAVRQALQPGNGVETVDLIGASVHIESGA